jgi:hypothetical protein
MTKTGRTVSGTMKTAGIEAVKAIIRRNPDWTGRPEHRAMLVRMLRRISAERSEAQ